MSIFTRAESKKEIEVLKAENERLHLELSSTKEALSAFISEENIEMTILQNEISSLRKTHEEELKTFDERVQASAIQFIGSVGAGVTPVAETESDTDEKAAIMAVYKSMKPGHARMTFRKNNEKFFK